MKVLQLGKFYPPHRGGMESHLETLCSHLLSQCVEMEVLVSNNGPKTKTETINGIPVTRLGTVASVRSASINLDLVTHIRRSRADVIHIHWPNPSATLAYLASRHPAPLVVTYHSDVIRQQLLGRMFSPLLHMLLRKAASIIVTSPNYLESSSVLEHHKERCRIVPLGISEECFHIPDPESVRQVQQQYGENLILSVGRMVYYKGFEYLIEAMATAPGKLLLVGDGRMKAELVALTQSLGLQDRVIFLGSPSDSQLRVLYHAADLFVLPSTARSEAFGLVQAEAMAAGKPVINTSIDSGVPFVSPHKVSGLTVPPANAPALAAAIGQLIGDPALRAFFGKEAHFRAKTMFHSANMAAQTRQIYEQAVGVPAFQYLAAHA